MPPVDRFMPGVVSLPAPPFGRCAAPARFAWSADYPSGREFVTVLACPDHREDAAAWIADRGFDAEPGPSLAAASLDRAPACGTVHWSSRNGYRVIGHLAVTAPLPSCEGCRMPLLDDAPTPELCGPACDADLTIGRAEAAASAWGVYRFTSPGGDHVAWLREIGDQCRLQCSCGFFSQGPASNGEAIEEAAFVYHLEDLAAAEAEADQ